MIFGIFGRFLFQGMDLHTHQMSLNTRNKDKYGLGVGIAMVFEVLGHFLFKKGMDHPVWS
jgi:hypothetical protein